MGASAIRQVMPKVRNKALRAELSRQLRSYHNERNAAVSQLTRNRLTPEPVPALPSLMSKAGIAVSLAKDAGSSHIAEMMIQGTNMGIIELNRVLNSQNGISSASAAQARSVLKKEQEYIDRLKKFL